MSAILKRYRAGQVGNGVVPLRDRYERAVAFVCAPRIVDGERAIVPIGTAFLVGLPVPTMPVHTYWTYLVTARHIVQGEPETYVRFRTKAGDVTDMPVAEGWIDHPAADVSATGPGDFLTDELDLGVIPDEVFAHEVLTSTATADHTKTLMLGDRLYFIGLLALMPEMGNANVPMVRSGSLGRMYQENVPIKDRDGSVFHVLAHLIDCRSFNGFSGSPIFVQKDVNRMLGNGAVFQSGTETYLLGLLSAHFDMWVDTTTRENAEEKRVPTGIESPANTGVGIVTPVDFIRELLNDEVFMADRKKDLETAKKKRAQRDEDSAATPDDAGGAGGYSRSRFFRDLEAVTQPTDKRDREAS